MKLRIRVEGKSYDVDVEVLPEEGESPENEAGVELMNSLHQPPPKLDIRPEDRILRSPIAGVVVSITANIGQRVNQNDPVLVIEAMKMQTAIGAPVDGTVEQIHVSPGETVKPGTVLCTLV